MFSAHNNSNICLSQGNMQADITSLYSYTLFVYIQQQEAQTFPLFTSCRYVNPTVIFVRIQTDHLVTSTSFFITLSLE